MNEQLFGYIHREIFFYSIDNETNEITTGFSMKIHKGQL